MNNIHASESTRLSDKRSLVFRHTDIHSKYRSRNLFQITVAALVIFACGVTNAFAADRIFLSDNHGTPLAAKTDQHTIRHLSDLRRKVTQHGSTRLIVGIRAAFAPEGSMDGNHVAQQRHDIAAQQSNVLNKITSFKNQPKKNTLFKTIPFMAVRANAAELEELANLPEVTSIEEDQLMPPSLAESVPLIGATTAAENGYTGIGQTIAILDTGVDKTHPFLKGKVVSEACYSSNYASDSATSMCPGG